LAVADSVVLADEYCPVVYSIEIVSTTDVKLEGTPPTGTLPSSCDPDTEPLCHSD